MGKCFLCRQSSHGQCQQCGLVEYCSEPHLRIHYDSKGQCQPFKIDYKIGVGNVMVAARNIKATEIILEDYPAVSGPKNKTKPVCLECLSEIGTEKKTVCDKCHFPVCNEKCASGANHSIECPIFAQIEHENLPKFDGPCPEYSAVIPLRMLALKDKDPELYSRVNLLMDHIADMKEEELNMWKYVTVEFVRNRCNFTKYSEDELLRSVGIFLTNGVNQGFFHSQGLYPTFSFISHSCLCNSRFQIMGDRSIKLRAQRNISEGEEITTRYLPALIGSIRRRFKIRNNWNFDCTCERCIDPTELGTYHGVSLCQVCAKSMNYEFEGDNELPVLLPKNPLAVFSEHECTKCGTTVNGLTIFALTKELEREAESFSLSTDKDQIRSKIQTWRKVLHPNHFVIMQLEKRLMDILCAEFAISDSLTVFPKEALEEIVQIGKKHIKIVEVLEPGYSMIKGRLIRQMHLPKLKLAERQFRDGELSKQEFMNEAKAAVLNTKIAYHCLEEFGSVNAASEMTSLKDENEL